MTNGPLYHLRLRISSRFYAVLRFYTARNNRLLLIGALSCAVPRVSGRFIAENVYYYVEY
jgi:hypothetical protein